MDRLGLAEDRLVTCHQVHSAKVLKVEAPWRREDSPRADGMVTTVPGIALGVLAADCAPVLFADAEAGVIGAAHGGWRGALDGVAEATVAAMIAEGARLNDIRAAIGPCIGQDFLRGRAGIPAALRRNRSRQRRVFRTGGASRAFPLRPRRLYRAPPRAARARGDRAGTYDTVADPERFFSYRRACLAGESDYGRALAAIVLAG